MSDRPRRRPRAARCEAAAGRSDVDRAGKGGVHQAANTLQTLIDEEEWTGLAKRKRQVGVEVHHPTRGLGAQFSLGATRLMGTHKLEFCRIPTVLNCK